MNEWGFRPYPYLRPSSRRERFVRHIQALITHPGVRCNPFRCAKWSRGPLLYYAKRPGRPNCNRNVLHATPGHVKASVYSGGALKGSQSDQGGSNPRSASEESLTLSTVQQGTISIRYITSPCHQNVTQKNKIAAITRNKQMLIIITNR